MLREEKHRNGAAIKLESFPFDRVVHIPLNCEVLEPGHLSYARTTVPSDGSTERRDPLLSAQADPAYARIRAIGRHAALGNGKKLLAPASPFYFGPSHGLTERPYPVGGGVPLLDGNSLRENLLCLVGDTRLADALVRRLYMADPIQSLAVAGLVFHLVSWAGHAGETLQAPSSSALAGFAARLRDAMKEFFRALERNRGDQSVVAKVYMDREALLEPPSSPAEAGNADKLAARLGQVDYLPLYREFFMASEQAGYRYGLDPGVKSKLFYVYYSILAPKGSWKPRRSTGGTAAYSALWSMIRPPMPKEHSTRPSGPACRRSDGSPTPRWPTRRISAPSFRTP